MTSVGARRCGLDGARGARRHDRRSSTRSAARSRNDVLAARRALAVVVAAQGSRRGDGRAATKLSVRMTSVGARRCGRDGARGARRHDRRASTRSAARSRNDVLAARRALAVVVSARVSRRGDRQSSNEAEREDDVGRRSAVRPGRRTRRTTTRSARVDEVGGAIKERRARGSARARRRRGGSGEPARRWKSSNEAEREDDVGRRPAVRPGRRTRRTTTRSARVDEVDAARSRNDVLAARRALAVVVSARVSRRGDRQSSNEAEREDDVGRRSAVRPGRRTRRTTTRSARVDEVGGAIKERRARGSARARRRRGGSGEPARRWKSSNEAEREDDVGRRPAVRPGRRTRRTTTRSARVDEVRRRDQGTTCSRLGARSPSSCRLE